MWREVVNVVGDVEGKDCLDPRRHASITGGTMSRGDPRASSGSALQRHLLLRDARPACQDPAIERLSNSPVTEIAVTNTINLPPERRFAKLKILSIAPLLAKAIGYTHSDQSVSSSSTEEQRRIGPWHSRRHYRLTRGRMPARARPALAGRAVESRP